MTGDTNRFILKTKYTIKFVTIKPHTLLDGGSDAPAHLLHFDWTVMMIINTTSVWTSHTDRGCLTEQKGSFEVSQITG